MRSETGFDYSLYERFPTEKRPDSEVEELNRIWRAPKGWARLTAVNNNYVGFWYVVTAFGFFLAAGILLHLGFERWAFATYDLIVDLIYRELDVGDVWNY